MTDARPPVDRRPHPGTTAIVLAGGRSSRFGRDKLVEPLDGQPLLWRAIEAVSTVCATVVVVAPPGTTPSLPGRVLLVHDPRPFEGPLAAVAVGLAAVTDARAVIAGGDMPTLVPAVLHAMSAAIGDGIAVATLEGDGRSTILPMALDVAAARPVLAALLAAGERRLGALVRALPGTEIRAATWRLLDPDGRTLRDVDEPADL